MEGFTMDGKDKNVVEQIADQVNDLFEGIANTASDAFDRAIEPAPVKPARQSVPAYEFPVPESTRADAKKRPAKKSAKKPAM
jgi:cell division septation protein DedD